MNTVRGEDLGGVPGTDPGSSVTGEEVGAKGAAKYVFDELKRGGVAPEGGLFGAASSIFSARRVLDEAAQRGDVNPHSYLCANVHAIIALAQVAVMAEASLTAISENLEAIAEKLGALYVPDDEGIEE